MYLGSKDFVSVLRTAVDPWALKNPGVVPMSDMAGLMGLGDLGSVDGLGFIKRGEEDVYAPPDTSEQDPLPDFTDGSGAKFRVPDTPNPGMRPAPVAVSAVSVGSNWATSVSIVPTLQSQLGMNNIMFATGAGILTLAAYLLLAGDGSSGSRRRR